MEIQMTPEDFKNAVETIKSASELSIEVVKFLRVLTEEPLKELSGILTDKLKFYRWTNQQKMLTKAAIILHSKNLNRPTRIIPIKELIPLLEYASLENDEDLQTLWAALLANSADAASSSNNNLIFIETLKNLSKLEAQILQVICSIPNCVNQNGMILTLDLPNSAQMMAPPPSGARFALSPSDDVRLALSNLDRLGCISIVKSIGGDQMFEFIKCNELGLRLFKICSVEKTV